MLSCSTYKYNKVYHPASYCAFINGYWGNWSAIGEYNYHRYGVKIQYNAQSLEILIYEKGYHPSNFEAKIIINKKSGVQQDKDWTSYQGTITLKNAPLRLSDAAYMRYNPNPQYRTIPCKVNCDKRMQKAIQKNGLLGTISIFYNDGKMGDAITFR